jgi:phosphoenolpyruvate-protein phosphotransferase
MDGESPATGDPSSVTLQGIGVSSGTAIGPALIFQPSRSPSPAPVAALATDPAAEIARVAVALAAAAADLRALAERVGREVGRGEAGIFEAQALMLEDPTIAERVKALIEGEHVDGPTALYEAAEEQAAALAALPDPLWHARAADVRDAAQRALRHLSPQGAAEGLSERQARVAAPVVILAEDLAPSDTAQMRRETVLGICTAAGSRTAHAAILARALGIPAVVGLGAALFARVAEGDTVALDGDTGVVHLRPNPAVTATFADRMAEQRERGATEEAEALKWRDRPGQTRDGSPVAVLANVGGVADASAAAQWGAEGIGLLRTEFLFADRATLPDEHEQAALYIAMVRALGRPGALIVVRTLDAGNDKPLPALADYVRELPAESNPALGVRGFRLHVAFPALLAAQLRGLVRAAAATSANLHVMLPMVATVEEVRRGREALRTAEAELAGNGVRAPHPLPLGIMVETPAAALNAEALAREADFFSIGTNDLAQYVMASDRLNPRLAALADARQPAVLRAIAQVAAAGRHADRPVAVCGEMAGDPKLAGLLVGMGVGELSMSPASIPAVKRALAAHALADLRELAASVLDAVTLADVVALLARE